MKTSSSEALPNNASTFCVSADDGHDVDAALFAAPEPVAVVVIAPATGVRKEVYFSFASFLQKNGITALVFDYVGIGLTATVANQTRTVSEWIKLDLNAVLTRTLERFPGSPVILLGHSLGGQLIGLLPIARRLAGIVLVAVGVGNWRTMHAPRKYWYGIATQLLIPFSIRVFGSLPRWVGWRGEQLPPSAALEWSRWCGSPEYVFSFLGEKDLQTIATLSVPTLELLFSDDPIATPSAADVLLKYYEQLPVERRRICARTTDTGGIGHNGFFSRRSRALWPDTLTWIESQAGGER